MDALISLSEEGVQEEAKWVEALTSFTNKFLTCREFTGEYELKDDGKKLVLSFLLKELQDTKWSASTQTRVFVLMKVFTRSQTGIDVLFTEIHTKRWLNSQHKLALTLKFPKKPLVCC